MRTLIERIDELLERAPKREPGGDHWVTIRGHPVLIKDGKPFFKSKAKSRAELRTEPEPAPNPRDADDYDHEEADEARERAERRWAASLRPRAASAFKQWTEESQRYRRVAIAAWDHPDDLLPDDEDYLDDIVEMDSACARAPKHEGEILRGLRRVTTDALLSIGVRGAEFTTKTPLSFTADAETADSFKKAEDASLTATLVLDATEETGAVRIREAATDKHRDEHEVLVRHNTHLRSRGCRLSDESRAALKDGGYSPKRFEFPDDPAKSRAQRLSALRRWQRDVQELLDEDCGVRLHYIVRLEGTHDDHAFTTENPDPQGRLFGESRAVRRRR